MGHAKLYFAKNKAGDSVVFFSKSQHLHCLLIIFPTRIGQNRWRVPVGQVAERGHAPRHGHDLGEGGRCQETLRREREAQPGRPQPSARLRQVLPVLARLRRAQRMARVQADPGPGRVLQRHQEHPHEVLAPQGLRVGDRRQPQSPRGARETSRELV
jgi:hypothetical protein